MKSTPFFRLSALAALLMLSLGGVQAQSTAKDGLSDAERAKRDAEKVFSFIKFSTVKPAAAAAAPAAPAPAAKTGAAQAAALAAQAAPAAVRTAASPATQAAALAAVQASTSAAAAQQAPATPAPVQAAPASALAGPSTSAAITPPAATAAPATAAGLAAATAVPAAPAVVPEPEPEPDEVPLKLIAYTAPEMNAKVLNALGDRRMVVPVRFKVEANGTVSAAQALGNAPRVLELSAVRAVQQWKFDKLPASREVDVEIAFKAGD